jgi:predicted deacylase
LAHLLAERIIARSDVGIDFHSGSGGRINLPHVRCDLDHKPSRKLALAFGAPVALHAGARDGSLRAHAMQLGKPALLYEGGEAHRLDDASIQAGVDGALRVMASLRMIDESRAPEVTRRSHTLRASSWIRASRSGFCRMQAQLGEVVRQGKVVGQIVDPATGGRIDVRATRPGLIIGRAADSLVTAGDALLHVAETPRRLSG